MNSNPLMFLFDMDGVLTDWDRGVREITRELGLPELPIGTYDLTPGKDKGIYKDVHELISSSYDFWYALPTIQPVVDVFLRLSLEKFVLTAPGSYPASATPKLDWCFEQLGLKTDQVILTTNKGLLAKENRILVDDRAKNCRDFVDNGGAAILIEQPWSFHQQERETLLALGDRIIWSNVNDVGQVIDSLLGATPQLPAF